MAKCLAHTKWMCQQITPDRLKSSLLAEPDIDLSRCLDYVRHQRVHPKQRYQIKDLISLAKKNKGIPGEGCPAKPVRRLQSGKEA
jgi:hypothetical protein